MRRLFAFFTFLLAASCGPLSDDGPVAVAVIGEASSTFEEGLELAPAAQYVRAATLEGLVALDPAGQVVPAIAERWIVTDDGLSYIFRLRDSNWPDGDPITGEAVRTLLAEAISAQKDTALGFDLAKIRDVRAMTGRVIEIRLTSPMPEFLRLMAQPELGFIKSGSGAGPMVLSRDEDAPLARLSALPPESRGLPAREDWEENANNLTVQAMPATPALEGFSGGEIDLVLNGRLWSFPQVELGPLSRGTIQLDPARGLFGFAFTNDDGLLADPERREALSMAIERSQLVAAFGISGWQSSSWIIPPELFPQLAPAQDRWPELTLEQRQSIAARRIAQWENDSDEPVELLVALPAGPGAVLLYRQLARDWRAIGVTATRVEPGEPADLVVIDRVARYSSPRWFLNQFHCVLENALCSAEADKLVADSLAVSDPLAKERILAEAQSILLEEEVFIPLGAPVRWSLVRGAIDAYEPNIWGLHPLFPLSQPPI